MNVDLSLIISGLALIFGVYSGIATIKRNQKADNQNDSSQMTTVIVKLENISTGITEIKTEFNGMKNEVKELRDRLIITEQSSKSAWKRIESIENKGEN